MILDDFTVLLSQEPKTPAGVKSVILEPPGPSFSEAYRVSVHGRQVCLTPEEVDAMSLDSYSELFGVSAFGCTSPCGGTQQ